MKMLRELRERSGLTLREVEATTSISNSYLSQLENGKIKKPSAQTLYVLSKLYAVDYETLLVESGLVKPTNLHPLEMKPSLEDRVAALERRMSNVEFGTLKFI